MRTIITAALIALGTPAFAGDILVEDAFVRVSRPGAPTGAIFMTILNGTEIDDRLVAASTQIAHITELHTHIEDDGIMRMRQVEGGFVVPAGGSHELARGGDHVMLIGLTETLETGDSVLVTLSFEHAGDIDLAVPVDNERGQMQMKN